MYNTFQNYSPWTLFLKRLLWTEGQSREEKLFSNFHVSFIFQHAQRDRNKKKEKHGSVDTKFNREPEGVMELRAAGVEAGCLIVGESERAASW